MKQKTIKKLFLVFLTSLSLASCGDNKIVTEISDNGIVANGEFENGTILKSKAIDSSNDEYHNILEKIEGERYNVNKLSIYELSLEKDGKSLEPSKPISITLPKPFETEIGYKTIHLKNDNTTETLDTTLNGANITFTTSSFSTFIVTEKTSTLPIINPTYNFLAYADTSTQGKLVVNKEEKVSYCSELNVGDEIYLSAIPNEGYEFVGWYKGSKLSGSTERYDDFKDEAYFRFNGQTIEVYARFMPVEYKLNYDLNGGTLNSSTIPATYNIETETINLPTPAREYYTFNGWSNGKEIITSIPKGTTGNIELSAMWTQSLALPRSIEITKETLGEIEQGTETILSPEDYVLKQGNEVINGKNISSKHGEVSIEYKNLNSDENSYTTIMPNELGKYLIRVRISQSTTDPYYSEAISLPKEFTIVERVIKTKLNVLGNYYYNRYTVRDNKIVKTEWEGKNVLGLEDISGDDSVINGYQNTTYPIANSMAEYLKEKYTEVRIGSVDGVAIGRIRIYYAYYVSVEGHDENGNIEKHQEYSTISVQGKVLDSRFTKVVFELLPNVEGYTDSEGKWICTSKSLDVCTYSNYIRDNYNAPDIGGEPVFDTWAYSYEDERPHYQRAICKIKNSETDYGFYFFVPDYNWKYDIEVTGDVLIYRFDSRDRSTRLIPTKPFMTVSNERTSDEDTNYYRYIFVLQSNQQVTVYNGKAFSMDKVNQ